MATGTCGAAPGGGLGMSTWSDRSAVIASSGSEASMPDTHKKLRILPRLVANAHTDLISVSDDLSSAEFWLVTHPEFRHDPLVRAVVAFLRGEPLTDAWRPQRGSAGAEDR